MKINLDKEKKMDIFRTESQKLIDEEIKRLIQVLKYESPTEENYVKITNNLKALCEARERKNPLQMNVDTLLAIGANVLGLMIVLNFERTGVITSKAFGMLWRKS
jgi:hypothetical protein